MRSLSSFFRRNFVVLAFLPSSWLPAINITLDYSHDSFFASNLTAKAALEKAAADVSWAITTALNPLSQDMYTGTSGSSDFDVDWKATYSNPTTGANVDLNTFSFASDEFRIYVGMQPLAGSTLGQGGPGGAGFSSGFSGFENELVDAVNNGAAASNASMPRSGPVLGTLNSSLTIGATTAPFSLNYGYLAGNLWFDNDTDNDTFIDLSATLNAAWHFDHTAPVVSGKSDFYSVAVHEILHSVGFGGSQTWDALVSGSNWSGSEVINYLGTGTNVLESDGAHIKEGTQGFAIVDGVLTSTLQEAIMDPTLTVGTRKYFTDLDFAFLRDMGWTTATPVPEPAATAALAGLLALGLLYFRRRAS